MDCIVGHAKRQIGLSDFHFHFQAENSQISSTEL